MIDSRLVAQYIEQELSAQNAPPAMGSLAALDVGNLLLVLPDHDDSSSLREFLLQEGFSVERETRPSLAIQSALDHQVGLVVLDVTDPALAGLEVLKTLRLTSSVPVLAIAEAFDPEMRITALEHGADGCITRPWSPHEMAARIRAVLRRSEAVSADEPRRIERSGVALDRGSREVYVEGRKVDLTTTEFDILDILIRSAGNPVSREAVIRKLYNRAATGFDRSVNVHVSNLRKKLESSRVLIKAVRGTGYQFCLAGPSSPRAVSEPQPVPEPFSVL